MSHLAVESHTINIYGGTGGNGGTGGVSGGGGGEGEGPRTSLRYDITAESFVFTNNLVGSTVQQQSDFSVVKLGDVNLLDEIDKGTVIECRRNGRRKAVKVFAMRRIYRAQISGCQGPMTVVAYDNLHPEHIRAKVQEAQRYRHPLLAQLFGFTHSAGLNALIYHDDVMTISQIQKMHSQSSLSSHYVKHEMFRQMDAADSYWVKTTGASFFLLPGTVWIRPSTGKLCLDIGDGDEQCMNLWPALTGFVFAPLPSLKLTENELHNKLLHALKFDEFYIMFAHDTDHFYNFPSSAEAIKLPSILILSDCVNFKSHQLLTIPFPNHFTPDEIHMLSWTGFRLKNKVMPTGWTRVKYLDIPYENFGLLMSVGVHEKKEVIKWWLSQHSFVRKHLQSVIGTDVPLHFITKINFNCYLDTDNFTLRGTFMTDAPSKEVYLFLFPPQVEILDGQFIVTNPLDAEKYYWAFDPTGLDRLTDEIAEEIGLPTPEFSIDLRGSCWDATIIHEFLAAKAFDPDSQDAAIAMGYPLVDIEAMKRFAQELTGKHSIDCQDEEDDDGIYYSLALC